MTLTTAHEFALQASPSSSTAKTPYLTLNIPQALSLPPPALPEVPTHASVWDLILHRATHALKDEVCVGFAELLEGQDSRWRCVGLTYGQLPQLAFALASRLRSTLSSASEVISPVDPSLSPLKPTPTVAILCPSGLDFFVHTLAVWSLGFALLPIAIGTTKEGVKSLIEKTGACAVLTHRCQKDVMGEVMELFEQDEKATPAIICTEDTHDLAAASPPKSSATVESLVNATADSVLIIFHSSGSTGLPKPIYHVNRFWSFTTSTAHGTEIGAYTTTPLYHGGMSDFLRSLQAGSSIFFHPLVGSVNNTLSVEAILAGYQACSKASRAKISYFLSVPFVLEMLSESSDGLKLLSKMNLVSTGGAPLPPSVGDLLVHNDVPLVSRLGSSECGFLMSSFRDFASDKEWSWLRVEDSLTHSLLQFKEDQDSGGLFELVVTVKWPTKLLSNTAEGSFSTQDLYSRHQTHSNWYKYATRVDDTLVLLSGKKFAGGLIENRLKQSELVQDAVVFGSNRALVGAIIIPARETAQRSGNLVPSQKYALLKRLEPHIEEINRSLPSHARLTLGLLHVADDDLATSIPRSSKGTLQRGHAYRRLAPLFDEMYSKYEEGKVDGYPSKLSLQGEELQHYLAEIVGKILCCEGGRIGPDVDFYVAGMDSIASVRTKAAIHQHLKLGDGLNGKKKSIMTRDIYQYPTVAQLAAFLERDDSTSSVSSLSIHEEMKAMVERYSQTLPTYVRRETRSGPRVAILTGATGALGSHLLVTFLASSDIDQVVCLVRAPSDAAALQRVKTSIESRKLGGEMQGSWHRVVCLSANLSQAPDFGIPRGQTSDCKSDIPRFWTLIQSASMLTVIHAAWSVNFALSLKSFEMDNVAGLANLLRFSIKHGVQSFMFCSSIASVLAQDSTKTEIKEMRSHCPAEAGSLGYSQSKWVAEGICSLAAEMGGMSVRVARIGQLASDSVHGVWNESEAWPLMVRTARELGQLPMIEQAIDWLPVDVAARTLTELTLEQVPSSLGSVGKPEVIIYHVLLPVDHIPAADIPQWNDFLEWLRSPRGQYRGLEFETVSLKQWLAEVERRGSSTVRGRSLLDMIWKNLAPPSAAYSEEDTGKRSGQIVATTKAREVSKTLRKDARPIDQSIVQRTVDVWREKGFL